MGYRLHHLLKDLGDRGKRELANFSEERTMSDELKTYIEPELEARLVALVLGEASAFEAEELSVW